MMIVFLKSMNKKTKEMSTQNVYFLIGYALILKKILLAWTNYIFYSNINTAIKIFHPENLLIILYSSYKQHKIKAQKILLRKLLII